MAEEKVKLSVLGISFSQVQEGAYALIFAEENGIRRLPIVIGTPEAQSIAIVMENIDPPRPLTHDLIQSLFEKLSIQLVEVYIYKFEEGAFFADLLIRQGTEEYHLDSRTSDAVALAIRTGSPIYTNEEIMQKMAVVFDEKGQYVPEDGSSTTGEEETSSDAVPSDLSGLRMDALTDRLNEAVRDEDYELATRLRDEINKRKSNS